MLIALTYALRIGSVLALHTELRTSAIDFFGVYDTSLYGPSESILLYTPGVPGSAFSASIGVAKNGPIVIAPVSQAAGWVSWNVIVFPETVMPETLWPSM